MSVGGKILRRGVVTLLLLAIVAASVYAYAWYHRFYHHVTVQEASHQLKHSTITAVIRGGNPITLQLYQQENAADQRLVIFTSGDGGWSPFCADIAAHLAADGKTVVGFNAKDYLVRFATSQRPVSPDELARDYDSIISTATSQPGVDSTANVILAGWSLGAGYSVLVASDPSVRNHVERVVAVSLPTYNELAWKPTDALIYITHGTPREKVFDSHEYLRAITGIPVLILNATDDDTSPIKEADSLFKAIVAPKHMYVVAATGHHFEGGEAEFYRDLDIAVTTDLTGDVQGHATLLEESPPDPS